MELMSTSFDKFYKYVYSVLDDVIPEEILGKITLAVSFLWKHLHASDLLCFAFPNQLLDNNGIDLFKAYYWKNSDILLTSFILFAKKIVCNSLREVWVWYVCVYFISNPVSCLIDWTEL